MTKINNKLFLIALFSFLFILVNSIFCFAQNQKLNYNDANERDPFIPLIDERANLRNSFKKPSEETSAPNVALMGISKVGNSYYAIIDGELVKEGQVFNELKIEKIYADRVIVLYANKIFELRWETEKTNAQK